MTEQAERAKELYIQYYGSFVQMHRDGLYEEFKSYDVPESLQIEWGQEMIEQHSRELSIRNWDAVSALQLIAMNVKHVLIIENIIVFTSRHLMSSDSIVRLMYAERMMAIIKQLRPIMPQPLLLRSLKETVTILENIIAQPLIVDPGHELSNYGLKDKRALNLRAKSNVDAIMDSLN
ncbi:hypothetical protein ACFO9Q_00065 [Paenibacillus sp. GCM10023252]|uniref:hypothetical protein n=1 Tax=Paenibacillus sp. GCM10023252 TaxID=3252649 RepID=UPI0036140867